MKKCTRYWHELQYVTVKKNQGCSITHKGAHSNTKIYSGESTWMGFVCIDFKFLPRLHTL